MTGTIVATDIWNMYYQTNEELTHTNNSIKGSYRSFQGHLSAPHQTLWKFLKTLKIEETLM